MSGRSGESRRKVTRVRVSAADPSRNPSGETQPAPRVHQPVFARRAPIHTDDDSRYRSACHEHSTPEHSRRGRPSSPRPAVAGAKPRDGGLRVASRLPPRSRLGAVTNRARAGLGTLAGDPCTHRHPNPAVDRHPVRLVNVSHSVCRPHHTHILLLLNRGRSRGRDPQRSRPRDRPRRRLAAPFRGASDRRSDARVPGRHARGGRGAR